MKTIKEIFTKNIKNKIILAILGLIFWGIQNQKDWEDWGQGLISAYLLTLAS
jgi:hypothetical protein